MIFSGIGYECDGHVEERADRAFHRRTRAHTTSRITSSRSPHRRYSLTTTSSPLSLSPCSLSTMSFDLTLPVNSALLLYILYCVQRIVFPSTSTPSKPPAEFKEGYSWMPRAHPPTLFFKTYTPRTLMPFDGQDGKRILLAISGVVYDVTAGRNFYGPSTYPVS